MQDFYGTHKTRDAPALEKSLRGVLHTVKEAEEHIRYSRPKLQIINRVSHLVSSLISAHQPSDLSPDCILPVTMYSHLSETRDPDCLDSCSVPVKKIWLTLHHVFTSRYALASGPRVQCQYVLHIICRLGVLNAVLASQPTA